jgi:hypothetical protein
LLSWNKKGALSLSPLVMESLSVEQQRSLKQEIDDLRSGVYYRRASPRQKMYFEMVGQQEERLVNMW